MTRHGFDPFSFIGGLFCLGVGLVLLSGGIGALSLEWVGPSVAILVGILIVVAARPERAPKVETPLVEAAASNAEDLPS